MYMDIVCTYNEQSTLFNEPAWATTWMGHFWRLLRRRYQFVTDVNELNQALTLVEPA